MHAEATRPVKLGRLRGTVAIANVQASAARGTVARLYRKRQVHLSDDALQLVYRTPAGVIRERLLTRSDEPQVSPATRERP